MFQASAECSREHLRFTKRSVFLVSVALCWSIVGGCDRAALMRKVTPTEDEAFARECVDLLRQKQFEQLQGELDSSISDSNAENTLRTMAEMFPTGEPKSVKVVGLRFQHDSDSSTHNLTF